MGSDICSNKDVGFEFTDLSFRYQFGQENDKTLKVPHEDQLKHHSREIQKNLKDCEQKLKKTQKLYKDKSINISPIILKSKLGYDQQVKCTFQRPYIFLNLDPKTAYSLYDKNDINICQINIRNENLQYFGTFLCFLAKNPKLLYQILLTESNNYGIHCISMYINSIKQFIYIDDYIFCYQKLVPFFSQPIITKKSSYLWTCILQKAWLKINNNITNITKNNHPIDVFKSFLPYPIKSYILKYQEINDPEKNAEINKENLKIIQLLHNLSQGYGCIITTKEKPKHKIGLSGQHFYFIKSFKLQGTTYYYLRNPCQKSFHFRGKRSHLQQQFANKIKKHIDFCEDGMLYEGNFLLEEDELLQQIQSFFIVYYDSNSNILSEQILQIGVEKEYFLQFQIKKDTNININFSQSFFNNNNKNFSPLSFLIFNQENGLIVSDLQNNQGSFGVQNTNLLANAYDHLKAGKYLVRLLKKPNSNNIQSGTIDKLNMIAGQKIQINKENQALLKQRYEYFLKEIGKKKLHSQKEKRTKIKSIYSHIGYWIGDIAVIYIKKSQKMLKQLIVEVGFLQLKNLKCTSDNKINNNYVVLDPIDKDHLIIFEKISLMGQTRLGKYNIQHI